MAEGGEIRSPTSHRTPGQVKRQASGYNHRPEQIKKRVQRDKARRQLMKEGAVKKYDGKDVNHKKPIRKGGTNDPCARREVVLGDNLLAGMREGSTLLIHSTVHPDTCRHLAEEAGRRGVAMLDAPVSGGGQRAVDGQLVVMVGGDRDVFERCRPVLESYGNLVRHLGDVGTGQLCKLINNAVFTANVGVAGDAFELAEALAIDREALAEVVGAGSGASFPISLLQSPAQLRGLAAALPLLEKDIDHATRVARSVNLELPVLESAARHALDRIAASAAAAAETAGDSDRTGST